jgi:hypothetical protein
VQNVTKPVRDLLAGRVGGNRGHPQPSASFYPGRALWLLAEFDDLLLRPGHLALAWRRAASAFTGEATK